MNSTIQGDDTHMQCTICEYIFDGEAIKPFYLPCSHLICEFCLEEAKAADSMDCCECYTHFSKLELDKLKFNKNILRLVQCCNSQTPNPKLTSSTTCRAHNKLHIKNIYCFYHKIRICQDCMIEHQFSLCNIKSWSSDDSHSLVNALKFKYSKISDIAKDFNECLNLVERNIEEKDPFYDHLTLTEKFNKVVGSGNGIGDFKFLKNEAFLQSSMSFSTYLSLMAKMKEQKLITNENCLKFFSNNFKIGKDYFQVNYILKQFPNVVIHCYNKYNEDNRDSSIYIKKGEEIFIFEPSDQTNNDNTIKDYINIDKTQKLKLVKSSIKLEKEQKDIILTIEDKRFKYFEILLFDNIVQLLNESSTDLSSLYSIPNIEILYFNNKYFVFDFLNLIDINQNILKIGFLCENKIRNLYIKLRNFSSTISEFIIDDIIIDHQFHYNKIQSQQLKIRKEGTFSKYLEIENFVEVSNGHIKVFLDKTETVQGKVDSILYLRFN